MALVALVLIDVWSVGEWWVPRFPVGRSLPPVYAWLGAAQGQLPGKCVLELPLGDGRTSRERRNGHLYSYFAALHTVPIVNGFHGYPPALLTQMADQLATQTPDELTVYLSLAGIRTVIWHSDPTAWADPVDVSAWAQRQGLTVEQLDELGALLLRASPPAGGGTGPPARALVEAPRDVLNWALRAYPFFMDAPPRLMAGAFEYAYARGLPKPLARLIADGDIALVATPRAMWAGNTLRVWLPEHAPEPFAQTPGLQPFLQFGEVHSVGDRVPATQTALSAQLRRAYPVAWEVTDALPQISPTRPAMNPYDTLTPERLAALGIRTDRRFSPDVVYHLPPPPAHTSQLALGLPPTYRAPPDAGYVALELAGYRGAAWANPDPQHGYRFTLTWEPIGGGDLVVAGGTGALPLALRAGQVGRTYIRTPTPKRLGRYRLTITPEDDFMAAVSGLVTIKPKPPQ